MVVGVACLVSLSCEPCSETRPCCSVSGCEGGLFLPVSRALFPALCCWPGSLLLQVSCFLLSWLAEL